MTTLSIICHSQSSFTTPIYGGGGNAHLVSFLELEIIWNLAPIKVQWRYLDESSYDWYKGTVLTHFQCMDSDGNPSPKAGTIYDSHSNLKQCASISLQLNEYIDSYRIQSSERVNGEQIEYIYGIHFKTSLDNTFSCGGSPPFRTLDSGWIAYKGYYLAGFVASAGDVLDSIGFCFINVSLLHLNMEQNVFCNITSALQTTTNPTTIPTELRTQYPITDPNVNPAEFERDT
eukprot:533705_1